MTRGVRFLFGDELIAVDACDPTLTVLDWLRLNRLSIGTKEGCAEGDCGACTVVVGRLTANGLRYEAINACIRFLATLDGCHLLAVEHLKGVDGALHPVQQALVSFHGSQCGFCTPGIVMSLYALWLNEPRFDRSRVEDALAGNLCRCTGYRPILDAALSLSGSPQRAGDRWGARAGEIDARLRMLADDRTVAVGDGGRRFFAPATAGALATLYLDHPDATLVAGATDVGLWVTKQMQRPDTVIALGRIAELQGIDDTGASIRFGAMANHIAVRRALATLHPQLDELMRRFGGEQVRNAGTIGGNIANGSPIGDLAPALIALGATLHLRRGDERRSLPLEDFFLAYRRQDRRPGEFVEAITVPKLPAGALFHVSKISKRFDEDISAVCGAFRLDVRDGIIAAARLAFGGMAGTPQRATRAEAALTGKTFNDASVEAAIPALADDFTPLTDMRASTTYRRLVAGNLLRRFLIETTERTVPTRVAGALAETAHA